MAFNIKQVLAVLFLLHCTLSVAAASSAPAGMRALKKRRWANNEVPVRFDLSYPADYHHKVLEAMEAVNSVTCLNLRLARPDDEYVLKIVAHKLTCSSQVGNVKRPDRGKGEDKGDHQLVNLHPACFWNGLGSIVHEFVHAVGFNHQQSRPDRDAYVNINRDEIVEDREHNFKKVSGKDSFLYTWGLPYDYNSIMHYAPEDFQKGSVPVITLKHAFEGHVGHTSGLSRSDVAAMNRMYECHDHYLGDDITGAVGYDDFFRGYMADEPEKSDALNEWERNMKALIDGSEE